MPSSWAGSTASTSTSTSTASPATASTGGRWSRRTSSPGRKAERDRALAAAVFHWKTFATRYKGIPSRRLSFDLINEPPWVKPYEGYLFERYDEIVRALVAGIREADPGRLVFADGLNIGQTPVMEIVDVGVVQSTRGYLPKAVSHYTATWVPKEEFESFAVPTWPLKDDKGTTWDKERLRKELIEPWQRLAEKGVAVHVGEWGCYNKTPHDVALAWMGDFLSLWKEAGWGWALWNLRGRLRHPRLRTAPTSSTRTTRATSSTGRCWSCCAAAEDRSNDMTAPQEATAPERAGAFGLALGALFFLSGALGLLYEIVWFRRLHLALGVSLFAVGAVVSAYMLGLAVGSRWAARSAWLRRSPLTTYAGLELGIALYALAFPLLVGALEALYPALFRALEGHPLALSLTRFVLAFVLLLPPTFLMGASLPAMAEAVVAPPGQLARRVAWLYALNTVGGVAGTLVAGFFLIEHLGITRSLYSGAAGSALVAVAAFALARHPDHRLRPADPAEDPPRKRKPDGPPPGRSSARSRPRPRSSPERPRSRPRSCGPAPSSSSSTTRRTPSVPSWLCTSSASPRAPSSPPASHARRRGRSDSSPWRSARAPSPSWERSPSTGIFPSWRRSWPPGHRRLPARRAAAAAVSLSVWSWGRALAIIFGQVAAVLFLPALLLGAVFPLTLKLAPASGRPAQLVGRLYAVNTVGCVVGTVLGTFVLVALLGTRGALLLLAWLPAPIALWALREATPSGRARMATAGIFVVALAGGSLAAAPRGFYQDLFEKRFGRVVWFAEGITETVAVCEHKDGSRWIQFSDGRGASGTWSFQGGWLYAHLPLLLHPRPRSAAVVCFGTGNTLGAASLHGLDALDGIELSPEVVKAAPLFAATNHGVTTSGRARIVIEDGRSYMLATDRRYDVITEEPPLVHTAGVVNLYSRDFYELCSRRLAADGILAVWLATWELETTELRMLVRAFVDAFPHASLWDCTHPGEWLLIGSKEPLRIDLDALAARMASPEIARDLARIDADTGGIRTPADLLSLYLMGRDGLAALAGDARPVTDDRSVVDFTTPRHARANFGLGEWVTGGLSVSGVGERGLQSELLLRDFDRVYTFREPVAPMIASYGGREPEGFLTEVREKARARELKAARMMIGGLRRMAADLRAMGQPERSLDALDRGLALVPAEARGPIDEMRAQLLREMETERR